MEIKVEVGIGDQYSEPFISYFYWDVRDCRYYSPCPPPGPSFDITLRYDRNNNNIWYFPTYTDDLQEPTSANGWMKVNNQTKNAWDRAGLIHCPLDFSGFAPETPNNFSLSGSIGQHPVLTWEENTEPDIEGYKIYVDYNNTDYSLLYTISDPSVTAFTDNGVTITGGKFDPTICYKITAFDVESYESNPTLSKCTKGSLQKNNSENGDYSEDNVENKIEVYPNPFNPKANVILSVKEKGNVLVVIYNLLGEQEKILLDELKEKGNYYLTFDGNNLASGMYIITFKLNNYFISKQINLIK